MHKAFRPTNTISKTRCCIVIFSSLSWHVRINLKCRETRETLLECVLDMLCSRWGQVPLSSCDSHDGLYISRFTSWDKGGGETGCLLSKVNQLPQTMSLFSLWVNKAQNHFQASICPIQPTDPFVPDRNTQSYIITPVSLGGFWLSHTRLPVYFWSFQVFSAPVLAPCEQSPRHPLVLTVCVYPCGETHSFIKGAMERTVCHVGLSTTVPHCFRGWMSHGRQIRDGGIWEGIVHRIRKALSDQQRYYNVFPWAGQTKNSLRHNST